MTVLVTGGCGYIGSHMVLGLRDRGEDVVVIDSLVTGLRRAIADDVPLVNADIGDAAALKSLFGKYSIEAVVHFAASTVVPDSVADPLGYYLNNTVKSHTLLSAAVTAGVTRFILSSTAAVYGTPPEPLVSEETPALPASPYGASKLFFERILTDAAAAHHLSTTILRYFNVAGADPAGRAGQSTPRATHLIKRCCQVAVGLSDSVDVFGTDYPTPDGTGVRDYIHVSDLIGAHLLALDQMRASTGTRLYNCGYGRGFSVLEVIAATRRVSNVEIPALFGPRRPGDLAEVVARADRLRDELGWSPRYEDLETIVAHALAWERRSQDNPRP
jgi:UDP-glucose 4-epimerase